jgi:hypothetical protein
MSLCLPRHRPLSGLLIVAFLALLAVLPTTSQAAACDPPVSNRILCENSLPGTPESVWGIDGAGDQSIQGFATAMSVTPGTAVNFKIKSSTTGYKIDIYRLGYYGGDGARRVDGDLVPTNTAAQPACATDSASGLVDCGNWSVSRSWTVPSTALSGVYVARLKRNDNGGASHITFVVRDDTSTSSVVFKTDDSTWQSYNTWGGNSMYQCTVACPPGNPDAYKAAYKVSYNRPFLSAEDDVNGRSWIYYAEYPMIRFLERSGYDVSYISDVDVHARGALLKQHRLLIASGHDEYWSQTMRDNVEAARDAGVNLAFFTGNEIFWKTRWEPSIAGGAVADRTIVSYKDTHFATPQDPVEWTGTWRDPRFTTPPNRPTPENALTGQSFLVNSGTSRIVVPQQYGRLRMWRNTAAATLPAGGSLALAPSTLGYEWDEDPDNGFRPAGQFRLSSTTVSGVDKFLDYGSFLTVGTATHNLTSYRAPSGARVFGAGTVQWTWGLDDYATGATDLNMQQATVNLFADMKAQPGVLLPGLVAATASTDTTPPASSISSPTAGATLTDGAAVTVTGTASDVGGNVAGVEVSTDGGGTWHPTTSGTTSWSYSWIAHGSPSSTIRTRAVDDSGNIEAPNVGVTVSVGCPCSIWGPTVVPPIADSADPAAIEVGVKFKSDVYGAITGVRFYKAAANGGTHSGSLWTTDGARLAQATFTGESGSGWQTATFANPVQILPDTTYIASYYAPQGHYSATSAYLYPDPAPGPNGGARLDAAPLHVLRDTGTTRNGLYAYSATSTFPSNSFGASNYWVDVAFQATPAPGAVTDVTATSGGMTSANVTWTAPSGAAVSSYTITPYVGAQAQTQKTITGSPPATTTTVTGLKRGTAYTFTVQALNPAGAGPESAKTPPVTPLDPVAPAAPSNVLARPATQSAQVTWTPPGSDGDSPLTGYTITPYVGTTPQTTSSASASATSATVGGLTNGTAYTFTVTATNAIGDGTASAPSSPSTPQSTIFDFSTPATVDSGEGNALELGVKFTPSITGTVTGVRFYKAAANTGVHIGSLWQASGVRLAQATFSNESSSGWQTVTFSTPIAVTAGTTYVASYYTPSGHYSATSLPAAGVTNGPLTAVSNATTPNGVYAYGPASTFPVNSYNGANYWVDVLFAYPPPGPATNVSAVEGGRTSATVSWSAPTSGGTATAFRVTPYAGVTALAPTTISGAPPATSTTIGGLTNGTTYTFTVQALNPNGGGEASAQSNAVTPLTAVAPPPPTQVRARPATASALVSWSAPDGDGDSPITGYTITPYIGTTAKTPTTAGPTATSVTVNGLVDGSSYQFKVNATNDVGAGAQSVPSAAVTPQGTIFDFASPTTVDGGDSNAVEVGMKFQADLNGSATGVRFYKAAANTGVHSGSLWSASGTRLAQVTFGGESSSGWQHATFSSAVAITAGTTYVVSYFAPNGHYSVTSSAFSSGAIVNAPLRALADATSSNGVYAYTPTSAFPSNTYNAGNYWVDVLYSLPVPGQPTNVAAVADKAAATVSWSPPATGGAVGTYTITPYVGTTAQTPVAVSGSLTTAQVTGLASGTSYTFRVTASNVNGSGPQSVASNAVTPLAATAPGAPGTVMALVDTKSLVVSWSAPSSDGGSPITGYTITPFVGATAQTPVGVGAVTSAQIGGLTNGTSYTFTVRATNAVGAGTASSASAPAAPLNSLFEFTVPPLVDAGDISSVVLGVKFTADVAGTIAGVRFYKAAANVGTHVGALWSATGSQLRQATFAGESASGWQTVRFATPVAVAAGTTYVATYLAPNGHYSVTSAAFAGSGFDNAPLHALADPISSNGVYLYSATNVFPTNSHNAGNYWVDVLFAPGS